MPPERSKLAFFCVLCLIVSPRPGFGNIISYTDCGLISPYVLFWKTGASCPIMVGYAFKDSFRVWYHVSFRSASKMSVFWCISAGDYIKIGATDVYFLRLGWFSHYFVPPFILQWWHMPPYPLLHIKPLAHLSFGTTYKFPMNLGSK